MVTSMAHRSSRSTRSARQGTAWRNNQQPLKLMLLRFRVLQAHDQLFAHERRLLSIQQLQSVGPGSGAAPGGPAVHSSFRFIGARMSGFTGEDRQ